MHIFDQTCSAIQARRRRWPFLLLILSCVGLALPARAAAPCFARFTIDRQTLYQGESFQLTLAIYSTGETLDKQISIANMPPATELQLRGFDELPIENTQLDGQSYDVRKFRTWARAPKAGPVTLFPRLDGTLVQVSRAFFFMSETRHPVHIQVEPLSIPVMPLPPGRAPTGFSGLVGQFSFKSSGAPLDIALGDLISITYRIEGDWLPDDFLKPQVIPENGLKVYEVKPLPDECSPTRVVYRQTVVPESPSLKVIPATELSYFDTRDRQFRTLRCGPFPVTYHQERTVTHPIYAPPRQDAPSVASNQTSVSSAVNGSGSTWWHLTWNRLCGIKEATLTGTGEMIVRFAPSESSRELFTMTPGATVRIESINDGWIRISCLKGTGWIQKTSITPAGAATTP